MKIVYIAHPLGQEPGRTANRARAARWVAWAADNFDVAPVATWVTLAEIWDETKREKGLAVDRVLVEAVTAAKGEIWLVGGRVSPGMKAEAGWTLPDQVVDLTALGEEPPTLKVMSDLVHLGRGLMAGTAVVWTPEILAVGWVNEMGGALSAKGLAAFFGLSAIGAVR